MSFLFCQRYSSPRSHFANLLGCQNHFQRGRLPVKEKHLRYNVFCSSKTTRFGLAEGCKGDTQCPPANSEGVAKEMGESEDFLSCATLGQMTPLGGFAVRNQQRSNRQSVLVARLRRLRWFFPRHWKICRRQIFLVNNRASLKTLPTSKPRGSFSSDDTIFRTRSGATRRKNCDI